MTDSKAVIVKEEITPANVVEMYPLETLITLKGKKAFDIFSDIDLIRPYTDLIRKETTSIIYDMNKKEDLKALGSSVSKISRTKTAFVSAIKGTIKTEEARVKAAKEAAKFVESEMNATRDAVDAPRVEHKKQLAKIEENRVNEIKGRINNIADLGTLKGDESKETLSVLIQAVEEIPVDESFQEFSGTANEAKASALQSLNAQVIKLIEKEQAEETARKLNEERRRNAINEKITNLMMMTTNFIGKQSAEIDAKIAELEAYTPTEKTFDDRTQDAANAITNVVMQLKMLSGQAKTNETLMAEQAQRLQEESDRKAEEDRQREIEAKAERERLAEQASIVEEIINKPVPDHTARIDVINPQGMHTLDDHQHTSQSMNRATVGQFKTHQPVDPMAKKADIAAARIAELIPGLDLDDATTLVSFIRERQVAFIKFEG